MVRTRKGTLRILALLAVAALALAACGGSSKKNSSSSGPTIAFVGALTGSDANLGVNIRDGVKLAINEANAQPGVKIKMKEVNTAGDSAQIPTVEDQYLGDKNVIGLVGPAFSQETSAALPHINDAGLVMISASATRADLPTIAPSNHVFHRAIADDDLQASGISEFMRNTLKPTSVAYVNDNSAYGKGLSDALQKLNEAAKIKTAGGTGKSFSIVKSDPSFQSTVNALVNAKPAVIFYGGYYSDAGKLRKELVDAKVTATFVSGDGSLDPGFISAAGPAQAEGAILTCPCNLAFDTSTGALKDFYNRFKAGIGREPGLYSPEAYDAANILIKGIRGGATTRAALKDFVNNSLGSYEGVSKTIAFASNGNLTSKEFFVFTVKNGKLVPSTSLNVQTVVTSPPATTTTTAVGGTTSTAAGGTTSTTRGGTTSTSVGGTTSSTM